MKELLTGTCVSGSMLSAQLIDDTPDSLLLKHGRDALRIVEAMIDHAIARECHNEALELDRMRRALRIKLALVANQSYQAFPGGGPGVAASTGLD